VAVVIVAATVRQRLHTDIAVAQKLLALRGGACSVAALHAREEQADGGRGADYDVRGVEGVEDGFEGAGALGDAAETVEAVAVLVFFGPVRPVEDEAEDDGLDGGQKGWDAEVDVVVGDDC